MWNKLGDEEPTEQFWIITSYIDYIFQMGIDKPVVNVKVNKPDYIYLFDKKRDKEEETCAAGAVTNRGRMAILANVRSLTGPKPTKDQICQRAADQLMAISNLKAEALENPLHME